MVFVGFNAGVGSSGIEAVIAGATTPQLIVGGAIVLGMLYLVLKMIENTNRDVGDSDTDDSFGIEINPDMT